MSDVRPDQRDVPQVLGSRWPDWFGQGKPNAKHGSLAFLAFH